MGGIGSLDGVIEVAVWDDWKCRAKLLFVHDADALAHARKNGWLEEVAVAAHWLTTSRRFAASRKSVVDEFLDTLVLGTIVDWPNLDTLTHPIPDPYLPGPLGEGLNQVIVQGFWYVYVLDGRANLAAIDERSPEHTTGYDRRVGVVEDNRRIIASQLQSDPLEVGSRCSCDGLASRHRPCETDLA